jgi:polyisoprenoid-binding protein YceI
MRVFTAFVLTAALAAPGLAQAAENYVIDTEKQHAFVGFRIQHLGFSWMYGRFNDFQGTFTYDQDDPSKNRVTVTIDPASIDTNHAERDKHLRSEDFLHVKKYPEARFAGTKWEPTGEGTARLTGDLTLRGVTKEITLDIEQVGAGPDPWGGFRRGFLAKTELTLADFGIDYDLGPSAKTMELTLSAEGIRQ